MNRIVSIIKDQLIISFGRSFHLLYKLGYQVLDLSATGLYEGHLWHQINKIISSINFNKVGLSVRQINRYTPSGMSERIIEIPWIISKIGNEKGEVLDAGSSLNFRQVLMHKKFKNKRITIFNLNPERNCYWDDGVSYVYSDLRGTPFADSYFDTIACVSVLEHVGMNNERYTHNKVHKEDNPTDYLLVIKELRRVLKKGGRLLLTIPVGARANLEWMQIFDYDMVRGIVNAFEKHSIEIYQFDNSWRRKKFSAKEVNIDSVSPLRKSFKINQIACIVLTK